VLATKLVKVAKSSESKFKRELTCNVWESNPVP